MKKLHLIIPAAIFIMTGCVNENLQKGEKQETPAVSKSTQKTLRSKDEFIGSDAGKYIENYIPTDYVAGVSALKPGPVEDVSFSAYNEEGYLKMITRGEDKTPKEVPFTITANGIEISHSGATRAQEETDLSGLYGSVAEFSIYSQMTRSGLGRVDTVVTAYVPELIEITSPAILTAEQLFPRCYYKNFIIRWNADTDNGNGLIVSVEWLGTRAAGEDYDDVVIRRTTFIPQDNGVFVLPEALFEDMPDTAICYLTLLRAAIENVWDEEYSYKIVGETHAVMPFILIRNIARIGTTKL